MENIGKTIEISVLSFMPQRLYEEITDTVDMIGEFPEEIRLRAERRVSLTYGGKNIMLKSALKSEEITSIVKRLCSNSLYAYKETINSGYIPLSNGVRIGVCGSAFSEGGKVSSIRNITSLCIRIPKRTDNAAEPLCRKLRREGGVMSCIIFSPSGIGKTTVLRSVARIFSEGHDPLRVAVIDTREEIGAFLGGSGLCVDILRGYPKEVGIEIAARTLNSQLIICDEVFGEAESRALCGAVNCGIPIICSAHAGSFEELLARPGISLLHQMRSFDSYVRISRTEERFVFKFEFFDREGRRDSCN